MNKNIVIRLEKKEEYYEVENLARESFFGMFTVSAVLDIMCLVSLEMTLILCRSLTL